MTRYNYANTRGAYQEGRILAALANGPMTTRQIAESLHIAISSASIYLNRLRNGHVYISGFTRQAKGRECPLFALGQLPDAIYKKAGKRKPKRAEDRVTAQERRVVAALAVPMTAKQLGVAVSLSTSRAVWYVTALRKRGLAYIRAWESPKKRGDIAPIYALGSKKDAEKPRMSRADRYAADKKDPDKYERLLAVRRKDHMLTRARKKPQTPFSALFFGVRTSSLNAEG